MYKRQVKDHKSPESWDKELGIPPLREVVSGCGSNTEYISSFVDHHSKEEMKKIPSFIEDTPHLLREIVKENEKGPQPVGATLVTMDVTALYPSIPWKEGLFALKEALNRRKDQDVPTSFLLRLMLLVLVANIFTWNNKLFIQKTGTAIGTKAAVVYACLFMAWLENCILSSWTGTQPSFFKRFIDDIFFIWRGSKEELENFILIANSFHPNIKFTAEYNFETRAVNFLNTRLWIDEQGLIRSDLYVKENKKIQYLLPSSCHPAFQTNNIPCLLYTSPSPRD